MSKLTLFIFILFSFTSFASEPSCEDSLNELFANYQGDRSKIDDFLQIQAGITMHRLAYATLRNSHSKEQYRIENEILKLLEEVKSNYEDDSEFRAVYQMYHHPDNRLSRTALARVLPYLSDIINEQNGEQSAFRRKHFNIGLSDVRMLAILAEKENLRSNGVYDHRLFKNHAHDNSILNFTKVINSSVRNTDWDKENMLNNFEKRISSLMSQAKELLTDIGMPQACLETFGRCTKEDNGKVIIDEEFLNLIGSAIDRMDNQADLALRYDDVWLYTKSRIQGTPKGNERNKVQVTNPERSPQYEPPLEQEVITPTQSDEEVVLDYLVAHVLDNAPHLFTREDLIGNPEFTIALAQAIDNGILAKTGENRSFYYNGKKYILPELWNGEYSELGLGRAGSGVSTFFSRTFRIDEYDEDDINIPSSIPNSLHDDFMTTMNDQWENFDHKYAFEFNGKLYRYPDATPMEQGLTTFLSEFEASRLKVETPNVIPSIDNPLVSENLSEIAEEVRDGNRGVILGEEVRHISGAPVDLNREYARAKSEYNTTNNVVNEESDEVEFPDLDEIEELNREHPHLILKALVDRDRAFKSGDDVIDMYRSRRLDRSLAMNTIVESRVAAGQNFEGSDLHNVDTQKLKDNALAIMNGDNLFESGGKEYYSANGNEVRRDIANDTNSSHIEGMVDSELVHENLIRLNGLDNENLVIEYFAQNPHPICEYISIVNKEDSNLKVYRYEGIRKIQVFESPILLGVEVGDQRTRYRDSSFTTTNSRTGSGEYTFSNIHEGRINLAHPAQEGPSQNIAMGITGTDKSSAEVLLNPRQSNGNIEIPEPDKSYYHETYVQAGCPFIVLPETDQLRFKVIEGDLQLIPSSDFDHEQRTSDYHLSMAQRIDAKKIEIELNDPRYNTPETREFLNTLEAEKRQIMEDLNLTNDEYDQLVKLAFGIMGTESSFGQGDSRLFGLWNSYKFKESALGQLTVSMLKGEVSFIPVYPGTVIPIQTDPNNNSRGNTQIKNVREFLNESYPDIKQSNLSEPKNSAIATMYALKAKMDLLKTVEANHSAINEENRLDYLYYMYLGSTNQISGSSATPRLNPKVREANGYGQALNIYTEP